MRIIRSIAFLSFLLSSIYAQGQTEAEAALDTNAMLIGDHRKLNLTLRSSHKVSEVNDNLEGLIDEQAIKIIREGNWNTSLDDKLWSKEIIFSVYDTGYYSIPPLPITYQYEGDTLTSFSDELLLRVNTVELTDSTQLAPIKNIIEEPLKLEDFLPYLLGAVVLAIIIAGFVYFKKRRSSAPVIVPPAIKRPPHEIALEKLATLKEKKLWQQGMVKEYQSELTYIVREYIEGRYKVPALESTTDEILTDIKHTAIQTDHQEYLRRLLQQADLVKFAKAIPPVDIHERMFDQADEFVRQTGFYWNNEEEE